MLTVNVRVRVLIRIRVWLSSCSDFSDICLSLLLSLRNLSRLQQVDVGFCSLLVQRRSGSIAPEIRTTGESHTEIKREREKF